MQLRQLTLPTGFFVLSSAWPVALFVVDFSWRGVAAGGLLFGALGMASCTLVWLVVVGESPSAKRGAVAGAFVSLVSAVVVLPAVTFVVWFIDVGLFSNGVDVVPTVLLSSIFLGLVALLLSPLAAALGYFVATDPSRSPSRLGALDAFPSSPATRTLALVFTLVALAVVGAAAVQYADPTTPAVGDGPTYTGDAPATTQVRQATARTRSVSHTITGTTYRVYKNGSRDPLARFVIRHDRQRDVVRSVHRNLGGDTRRYVATEDAVWSCWCEPSPSTTVRPVRPRETSTYLLSIPEDGNASITAVTDDAVTVRFANPRLPNGNVIELPGYQTVTITRETGRLRSMTTRWTDDNETVLTRYHFERHGRTTVIPPADPSKPLALHVWDLVRGPLTGETPLHD